MHIVVFAEESSNTDRISRLLSESEIESCDLFVEKWDCRNKITACLGAIRKNFDGVVYLITESLPIPEWAFELDAPVSVVWKNQDPTDVALSPGEIEIDLWEDHEIDSLQKLKNVSHFLTSESRDLLKPCKVKCERTVYGLREDFFKLT